MILLSGVLTIIVSLFLSEENSIICNFSYFLCTPESTPNPNIFVSGLPDSSYFHPWALAALTNSILSGDTQIYSSFPSSLTSTEHV